MKHSHELFLRIAHEVAKESTAERLKVGAVIAKEGSIIEFGYNGTPSGWSTNICEENGVTSSVVIHAEMNTIAKCARLGKPVGDSILYITHAPCIDCAKHILASGIKGVVYSEDYRKDDGLHVLRQGGIYVTKFYSD